MEEKVFFNARNVNVTNARFIAQGQTYAMSGITSIKSYQQDPSRVSPIVVFLIGGVFAIAGGVATFIGLGIIALAIVMWASQKKTFSVLLNTASGESEALTSDDSRFISQVVEALNEAIIYRG